MIAQEIFADLVATILLQSMLETILLLMWMYVGFPLQVCLYVSAEGELEYKHDFLVCCGSRLDELLVYDLTTQRKNDTNRLNRSLNLAGRTYPWPSWSLKRLQSETVLMNTDNKVLRIRNVLMYSLTSEEKHNTPRCGCHTRPWCFFRIQALYSCASQELSRF